MLSYELLSIEVSKRDTLRGHLELYEQQLRGILARERFCISQGVSDRL